MFEFDKAGLIQVYCDGEMDSPIDDPHFSKYELIPCANWEIYKDDSQQNRQDCTFNFGQPPMNS